MDLSIIIVSWRVKDKLQANLEALFKSVQGPSFEVLVVDNNSADGTIDMLRQNFPQVRLIANSENFGFAKANNQAIKQAQGDFILLLNPDMQVFEDTLKNLLVWLKANPQAWVTSGRLVDEQGQIVNHVRRFPRLSDQLAIVLKLPHLFPNILNKYLRIDFNYDKPAKVDSIRGSFFAIRRQALEKVGLLDERFFVWFEEVDYCRRVYEAGGQVWYTPEVVCLDYVGQSFKLWSRRETQKIMRQSQLKYFAKWHSAWSVVWLALGWCLIWPVVYLADIFGVKSRAKT